MILEKGIKDVIIAAGQGRRVSTYTEALPKCMLEFGGKTLILRQVETLRKAGISDITLIKGYLAEKIQIPGVKYLVNERYAETNMVGTLMCAKEELGGDTLICYGDIIYEEKVLRAVLADKSDIGVVVDEDWRPYWEARHGDSLIDTESLVVGKGGNIIELGKADPPPEKAKLRYVGLIKLSRKGVEQLKRVYEGNPVLFDTSYMTDLLRAIIDAGFRVDPIVVRHGWLEFDTSEDYEKMTVLLESNKLAPLFRI